MSTNTRTTLSPTRVPVLFLLAAVIAALFGGSPAYADTDALRCATFDDLTTGTRRYGWQSVCQWARV